MLTGPLLLLILACPVWAFFAVRWLTRNQKRGRSLTMILLWIPLALLPFWQEFYIMASFKIYGDVYGGITKLTPVKADTVEIDARDGLFAPFLLEIPAVKYVKTISFSNQDIAPPTYWLSKFKSNNCTDPIHDKLVKSSSLVPRAVAKAGFCYDSTDSGIKPTILLKATKVLPYNPKSLFMVSDMSQERYQVIDKETGKILSEYLVLYAMPGWLRQNIWPYASPYTNPSPWVAGNEFKFPFQQMKYEFFAKAILAKDK